MGNYYKNYPTETQSTQSFSPVFLVPLWEEKNYPTETQSSQRVFLSVLSAFVGRKKLSHGDTEFTKGFS